MPDRRGRAGALYLARFGRRYAIVDAGRSQASWIPMSHTIPTFSVDISGDAILGRQRDHLARHGQGVVGYDTLDSPLGAACDGAGAILIDVHQRTTVPGLYAAGGAVRGFDQVVVAQAHAAVAATVIHNRCELPLAEGPNG